MEARLPEEKLKKFLGLLKRHGQSKKITVKQLESLTGLLNFACSVIVPGRPFLCRMYSLTAGMRRRLPYFTQANQMGAAGHMNMGDISAGF